MTNDDPITLWINELRSADSVAAAKLWRYFAGKLYELARKRLGTKTRRVYDEEDAALSAFHSVCAGIAAGRFPDLHDRDSLWHLLLLITARKVMHRLRHDRQQRRDVRRTETDSIFVRSDLIVAEVDRLESREPTPEFAAEFAETCDVLYKSLDDPELQQVVSLRMEGHTDSEIAQRMRCSRRTVQRRIEVIRRHWMRLEAFGG